MTAPTVYHLRNNDGVETFTGTISPAPGGGSHPYAATVHPVLVTQFDGLDVATGGLLTVDGVTLQDGDRVLVVQSNDADPDQQDIDSGIYLAHAGPWTRADDWAAGQTKQPGTDAVYVVSGFFFLRTWFTPHMGDGSALSGVVGTTIFRWTQGQGGIMSADFVVPYFDADNNRVAYSGRELDMGGYTILDLPTSDPGIAGALWNNSGTPAISTG